MFGVRVIVDVTGVGDTGDVEMIVVTFPLMVVTAVTEPPTPLITCVMV